MVNGVCGVWINQLLDKHMRHEPYLSSEITLLTPNLFIKHNKENKLCCADSIRLRCGLLDVHRRMSSTIAIVVLVACMLCVFGACAIRWLQQLWQQQHKNLTTTTAIHPAVRRSNIPATHDKIEKKNFSPPKIHLGPFHSVPFVAIKVFLHCTLSSFDPFVALCCRMR